MTQAIDILLLIVAVALAVPTAVFVVECLAAWWPYRPPFQSTGGPVKFAVLVPAHDEEAVIERTLRRLRPQVPPGSRLLVVADNCTDRTAEVARLAGAQVVERHDAERRGKGFALDFGLRCLADDPPEVVIVIDADCQLVGRSLVRLAARARDTDRPVQAIDVMAPPRQAKTRDLLSVLAMLVKNQVRPMGLRALGLPCALNGTGMAWPWEATRGVDLATDAIAEDLRLGLELAIAGRPPVLAPDLRVVSRMPGLSGAAVSQRTRWEHGHLKVLRSMVPRLIRQAVVQRRPVLAAMALDLAVPPLSLMCLMLVLMLGFTELSVLHGGSKAPLVVCGAALASVCVAVILSSVRFAHPIYLLALFVAPFYALWKVPIYFMFLFRPQQRWVRTPRDAGPREPVEGLVKEGPTDQSGNGGGNPK